MAKTTTTFSFLLLFFTSLTLSVAENTAYPTIPGTQQTGCSLANEVPTPIRREVYAKGRIYDITHRITTEMPAFGKMEGLGKYLWLPSSIKNGSLANNSEMKLPSTHTGTPVDAPGHFFDDYFDAGYDVDTLDLEVLNGPALLVDVPRDKNITAEVMESLNIPKGIRRVLFRTLNTDRARKSFSELILSPPPLHATTTATTIATATSTATATATATTTATAIAPATATATANANANATSTAIERHRHRTPLPTNATAIATATTTATATANPNTNPNTNANPNTNLNPNTTTNTNTPTSTPQHPHQPQPQP